MTDRPILFSGPMVCALLAGSKTQTRSALALPKYRGHSEFGQSDTVGYDWHFRDKEKRWHDVRHSRLLELLPYQVGDRLYVREAWRSEAAYDDLSPSAMGGDEPIRYEADGAYQTWGYPAISKLGRFRQGMHMPRWACRLTLIVTDVRVQRLQEISEADAMAEGVANDTDGWRDYLMPETQSCTSARDSFRTLWDSLNADRGYGWDANPWVTATTFEVIRQNIDQIAEAA